MKLEHFSHTEPQIYSYSRFSNIRQEKGRSLARQKKFIDEVSAKFNLKINKDLVMTDRGLSAFHGHHKTKGALGVFLAAVEKQLIKPGSVLIVESLDRLSREQPYIAQATLASLVNADIVVVTAADEKIYSKETMAKDPLGTMILSVLEMVRAHKESLRKTEASIDFLHGQIATHEEGGVSDLAGPLPFWISRKQRPHPKIKTGFELNEHEEIIRLIVDMHFKQGMGLRPISVELLNRGIKPPSQLKHSPANSRKPKNDVWGVSTLSHIVSNQALCGRYVVNLNYQKDGKKHVEDYVLESYYPAIMSEEEFDTFQAIKKRRYGSNKGDKSKRNGLVYLLTDYGNKSVCAKCGRSIGSQPQKQKHGIRRRLHCSKHKETANCCKSIIQDYIEDAFLISVARHIDYNLINTQVKPADIIRNSDRLEEIDLEMANVIDMRRTVKDEKIKLKLKFDYEALENEKEDLIKQKLEFKQFKIAPNDIKKFIRTVNDARDYNNNEARTFVKSILMQCIRKIEVHMEKKKLECYGYPNLFENAIVNVVDVEFYTDKKLSIFVSAETNTLLFSKISDEFADESLGSFTEEQLKAWNDVGFDNFQNLGERGTLVNENENSTENLWFASDLAEAFMNEIINQSEDES